MLAHVSPCVEPELERTACLLVCGEADIYAAVGLARLMAGQLGFERSDQVQLETIIIELASHALRHAGCSTLVLRCVEREHPNFLPGRQPGLEIVVEEHGSGIVDLARLLAGGEGETAGGNGGQVWSVRHLADEFAIESLDGRGTRTRACKWRM